MRRATIFAFCLLFLTVGAFPALCNSFPITGSFSDGYSGGWGASVHGPSFSLTGDTDFAAEAGYCPLGSSCSEQPFVVFFIGFDSVIGSLGDLTGYAIGGVVFNEAFTAPVFDSLTWQQVDIPGEAYTWFEAGVAPFSGEVDAYGRTSKGPRARYPDFQRQPYGDGRYSVYDLPKRVHAPSPL